MKKNLLLLGGYNMVVPPTIPPSGFWSLASRLEAGYNVRLRDCMESGPQCFKASKDDFLWADAVVDYSYGKATEKNFIHQIAITHPEKTFSLVTIAGVNDCWQWQVDFFGSLWHIEPCVKQATFFNIDVLGLLSPASHPLRDSRAVEIRATAAEGVPLAISPFVNVDCNDLVKGLSELEKHTSIKDHPLVLNSIVQRLGGTS